MRKNKFALYLGSIDHIANYFHSTAITDPYNGSNVISRDYYNYEKDKVQKAAEKAVKLEYWSEIIR